MLDMSVNHPVIESTAIHLPDDFLAQHALDNRKLTDENVNYLARLALDHFRSELMGMPMDWYLEEKIEQVFNELKRQLPTSNFEWHIQKQRASYWQVGESYLTWNVIVNKHLAVSFSV